MLFYSERLHYDLTATLLRPYYDYHVLTATKLRFHYDHTTFTPRCSRPQYDSSTPLPSSSRSSYDLTSFILRLLFLLSFSHKIYEISQGFVCLFVIRTSCPFSQPCFSFLYRLDRWVSRLNGFTLVILGPFIVCCSMWANVPCWRSYLDLEWFTFINCYLDGELSHWLIPHLPISTNIDTCVSSLLSFTGCRRLSLMNQQYVVI